MAVSPSFLRARKPDPAASFSSSSHGALADTSENGRRELQCGGRRSHAIKAASEMAMAPAMINAPIIR
jgi:hypothetical protein